VINDVAFNLGFQSIHRFALLFMCLILNCIFQVIFQVVFKHHPHWKLQRRTFFGQDVVVALLSFDLSDFHASVHMSSTPDN
jgi:hypothetical protein